MLDRPWAKQLIWLTAAGVLLAGAGALQGRLDALRESRGLVPPGNEVARNYPLANVMTLSLGGLRVPVVAYLWIRAENLKQAGRHYDAMQSAEMICRMMPHFPGVWDFHSWNLAWNISVQTHTPAERWQWVFNGIRLLRDEGIPMNPKSILLYRQLAWIFFSKMGQTTDEMHWVYKQRWAAQMQHLLAAPPYGTTAEAIDAFRPVAQAPLDTTRPPNGQGGDPLQREVFEEFLARHPDAARYVRELLEYLTTDYDRREHLRPDQVVGNRLLEAYNRLGLDEALQVVRVAPPRVDTQADEALSDLINSQKYAGARRSLLALVRAHILWNRYRMHPDWMLDLMEHYGPLDWRNVFSHGLYWSTYGLHVCMDMSLDDAKIAQSIFRGEIDWLNAYRNWIYNIVNLTWYGRLTYIENPRDPNSPTISLHSDWRFIEPTRRVHDSIIRAVIKDRKESYKNNILQPGHVNYLAAAVSMLYAGYRRAEAQEIFDWTKETYKLDSQEWKLPLEDFVWTRLNKDGTPIPDYAINQIIASLQMAYYFRATGNMDGYRDTLAYASLVYRKYQATAPQRVRLDVFGKMAAYVARDMLAQPRLVGFNLPLETRARLYAMLDNDLKLRIYTAIAPPLSRECAAYGLDFAKAFPQPVGLEEFLRQVREQSVRPEPSP